MPAAERRGRPTITALLAAAVAAGCAWTAGCAGAAGAGMDARAGAAPLGGWSRVVVPFQVVGADGAPYAHPFLGGFDVPRSQLVDIDADGDFDLFIQERSSELIFLENVGTPTAARYVWRTDRFRELDINEWYRFVDMDGDGDLDLLAEARFSYVRYYRNDGSPSSPRFVPAVDTLRTVDGAPIPSDRQNIPNATDIDCDGLTDLFIGNLTGTVARYEAVERGAAEPRFRLVTERFADIEIVASEMGGPAPSLHGANTMDFADYDGDGDVDLFWGDFFEAGLLLLENGGTCRSPAVTNVPVPFPVGDPVRTTGYNAPTVADLNGDGRPDMLIGVLGGAYNPTRSAIENLYHLEQTAGGFEVRTTRFLTQLDVGSEAIPAWVDDDGDGDLDLLVGSKIEPDDPRSGRVFRFENIGTADAPSLRWDGALPITGTYHYAPEPGDLDGDGRPDLLVGTWNQGVHYVRNTGRAGAERWELVAEAFVELTRGSNTTPALGDLDGDGDLDLVVGEASGALNYYENVGSASSPAFELVSDEWLGIDPGRRSHPELVDLDGDGDLDLVVGAEDGTLHVYRNRGTPAEARFVPEGPGSGEGPADAPGQARIGAGLPSFPYAAPTFPDLDGDGAAELVIGGLSGGLVFYRR